MANNVDDFADKPENPSYKAYFLTHLDSFSIVTTLVFTS